MGKFTKPWEELKITDDFMFCKTMSDKNICRQFLETLLNIKIEKIEYVQSEKELIPNYDSRGIRLDVYVKDSNRIFDIEMQTTDKKDLELRSRYYQGLMDIDFLSKKQTYKELKESYVIFICLFDPFGENLPIYTVNHYFEEKKEILFNDKTHRIFYNVKEFNKIKDNEEIKGLLSYLCNFNPTTELTNTLDKAVFENKINKNWRAEYMTLAYEIAEEIKEGRQAGYREGREEGMAEGRAEGLAEGKAEGKTEGRAEGRAEGLAQGFHDSKIDTARKMLKNNCEYNFISEMTGLSLEEISQLK